MCKTKEEEIRKEYIEILKTILKGLDR